MSDQEILAPSNSAVSQAAPDGVTHQEKSLTTFCKAVVDYLSTKDPESFQHCMNVCHKVIGPDLWTTNGESDSILDPETRDFQPRFAKYEGTRTFIAEFLLEHMAPFRNLGRNDLEAAALEGAFRFWPRACRLRLVDAVRKRYKTRNGERSLRKPTMPVGNAIDLDQHFWPGDASLGDIDSASHYSGSSRIPSSYGAVLRAKNIAGAPLYQLDAEALRAWYAKKGPALNALLGESLQQTFKAIVEAGAPQGAEQTRAVAEAEGVDERTARGHIARLTDRMKELIRTKFELFVGLHDGVRLTGYRDHRGHRAKNILN